MKVNNFGIVVTLVKIGSKILPTLLKFAKFGKFGLAISSLAVYSYLFTWQFAVIILIAIFFHENGHIWAMRRCGLKIKGVYFIPLVGGMVVGDGNDKMLTREEESFVAIMGPIWGLVLALIVVLIYFATGDAFYGAVAGWMAMINLFNLLPINPLDGGRIMKSVVFSINSSAGLLFLYGGILLTMLGTLFAGILLVSILLWVGSMEAIFERKNNKLFAPMPFNSILFYIAIYTMLAIILWEMMTYLDHIPEVEAARSIFM